MNGYGIASHITLGSGRLRRTCMRLGRMGTGGLLNLKYSKVTLASSPGHLRDKAKVTLASFPGPLRDEAKPKVTLNARWLVAQTPLGCGTALIVAMVPVPEALGVSQC